MQRQDSSATTGLRRVSVSTTDPTEAHEYLRATYVGHSVRLSGDVDRFRFRHDVTDGGNFSMAHYEHSMTCRVETDPLGYLLVGQVIDGRMRITAGRDEIGRERGEVFLCDPQLPMTVEPSAQRRAVVRFARTLDHQVDSPDRSDYDWSARSVSGHPPTRSPASGVPQMSSTTPQVGPLGAGFGRPQPAGPEADPAPERRTVDVGRTGARFGGARAQVGPAEEAPDQGRRTFDSVLRGYARDQVDAELRRQDRLVGELRSAVTSVTSELRTATARAETAESVNRELRTTLTQRDASAGDGSFGMRAEKLLRLAETEAVDVRSRASRDATDLMERSRIDAETYRHETEQALIARSAELDESAARRLAELREREEQLELQLAAARAEAERVTTAALYEADRLRRAVEAAAEEERGRVRVEADRMRDAARRDVERLAAVRDDARSEIARVARLIETELVAG